MRRREEGEQGEGGKNQERGGRRDEVCRFSVGGVLVLNTTPARGHTP